MPKVRFWGVDGDDVDRDFGAIEIREGNEVWVDERLEWIVAPGTMLPAPENIKDPRSPATAPEGGFRRVGKQSGLIHYQPVEEGWDGAHWLDRMRYHFRTVYLRPGEVEQ